MGDITWKCPQGVQSPDRDLVPESGLVLRVAKSIGGSPSPPKAYMIYPEIVVGGMSNSVKARPWNNNNNRNNDNRNNINWINNNNRFQLLRNNDPWSCQLPTSYK
jgi:hypothetical protein